MSTKYRNSRDVPLDAIITRLNELSDAVTGGRESQGREFTMRIPAECDRDADLVIAEAAVRLVALQAENEALRVRVAELEMCVDDGSDSWLLRKQAEAVESLIDSRSIKSMSGEFIWTEAAEAEAQSLRTQATKLEQQK